MYCYLSGLSPVQSSPAVSAPVTPPPPPSSSVAIGEAEVASKPISLSSSAHFPPRTTSRNTPHDSSTTTTTSPSPLPSPPPTYPHCPPTAGGNRPRRGGPHESPTRSRSSSMTTARRPPVEWQIPSSTSTRRLLL